MIERAARLRRRHQAVKAKNLGPNTMNAINSQHNLYKLQLSCCKIEVAKLADVLQHLPMLEIFSAKGVNLVEKSVDVRVSLKLKELRLEFCNIELVRLFDTSLLEFFTVSSLLLKDSGNVVDLLKNQANLKELSIGGIICEDFFESLETAHFSFKLTCLKIDKGSMTNYQNDALFKFLLIHAQTLKSLQVLYPVDNSVIEFILTNLPYLTHLEIPITTFSGNNPEYLERLPKSKIQSIKFFGIHRNLTSATALSSMLTNVKHLDLSQITTSIWFMEYLAHVCKTLKNVETLKIPNLFNQKCHESIYFPKLKSFSVAKIYDESIYIPFIRRHADALEKIFIGWTDDNFIKGLIVDEIMNCYKLTRVIICSYSPLVTRMFNRVSSKKAAWSLESRIKNQLDLEYIPLIFTFPDDKAVWDDRCRTWSDELIRDLSTVDNYGLNAFVNKYK